MAAITYPPDNLRQEQLWCDRELCAPLRSPPEKLVFYLRNMHKPGIQYHSIGEEVNKILDHHLIADKIAFQ